MKIELKRIEFSERMSEETNCFSANLYINGKHVGEASNQGHGGPTDYGSYDDEGRALIKEAEAYCKTLPPLTYTMDGETHSTKVDLEMYIDNLLIEHLKQKELQKFRKALEKDMIKGFVIGQPDRSYRPISFQIPLEKIMTDKPEIMVDNIKKYVLPKLVNGDILLNTNIPESFLEKAGLSKEQYMPYKNQEVRNTKKQAQTKGKGLS